MLGCGWSSGGGRSIVDELLDFGDNNWNRTDRDVISESIDQVAKPLDTRVSGWDTPGDSTGGCGWL